MFAGNMRGVSVLLLLWFVPCFGQANYQRGGWESFYERYYYAEDAPAPTESSFEVSKISPLPPYTRAKFNELWSSFREQYGIRDGLFVKWDWADNWLRNFGRGYNRKPSLYTCNFEVVSGVDSVGRPSGSSIFVRRINSGSDDGNRLDEDVRARNRTARGNSETTAGVRFYPADASAIKPKTFRATIELDNPPGQPEADWYVYYEVAPLPDNALNQTRFVDALKAGSSFRVILPKDVACRHCDGLGRPPGSRVLGAKCRNCGGSGKVRSAEICTVKW